MQLIILFGYLYGEEKYLSRDKEQDSQPTSQKFYDSLIFIYFFKLLIH